MKILEIMGSGNSSLGGAQIYVWRLAKGHQVTLATTREGRLKTEFEAMAAPCFVLPGNAQSRDFKTFLFLFKLAQQERIEVIHTHRTRSHVIARLVAKALGITHIAHVHSTQSAKHYHYVPNIVSVSETTKTHLVTQGIDSNQICVIYNGIDLEKLLYPPPIIN